MENKLINTKGYFINAIVYDKFVYKLVRAYFFKKNIDRWNYIGEDMHNQLRLLANTIKNDMQMKIQ